MPQPQTPTAPLPNCVLVTGGAGYIGSHAAKRLLEAGCKVVIIDDLSGGHLEAVRRLQGLAPPDKLVFVESAIGNRGSVERALREHAVDAVMHFAALIAVGESVRHPLKYYRTNLAGTLVLLESMRAAGTPRLIYSSTAAVYGEPSHGRPLTEAEPIAPINPYGASKAAAERLIADFAAAQRAQDKPFAFGMLRYFNVAGADRAGLLGEHHDPETHLIPVLLKSVLRATPSARIFGDDYPTPPTPDGTCVRDYVHVDDLVDAHVRVLQGLSDGDGKAFNVGTGHGHSVRQVVEAVADVTSTKLDVTVGPRRPGDPAMLVADSTALQSQLGWKPATPGLRDIVASAWAWMQQNPDGYRRTRKAPVA